MSVQDQSPPPESPQPSQESDPIEQAAAALIEELAPASEPEPAQPPADTEPPPAEPVEEAAKTHDKAQARAAYLTRRAAKLERDAAALAQRERALAEREQQAQTLTRGNALEIMQAAARARGVDVAVILREAVAEINGTPPKPEDEIARLRREVEELRNGATQREQNERAARDAKLLEDWRNQAASSIAGYDHLADEDPQEVAAVAYQILRNTFDESERRTGRGTVLTVEQALSQLNDRAKARAERLRKRLGLEAPPPAATPQPSRTISNRVAASPANHTVLLTEEDYERAAAAVLG